MQAHSPPDQIDVQEPPSQPRPSAAQVREEQRRLKEENERARQRFQATKVSINETWERLVRNLGGAAPDRDLRHAALNLLEDTELARLGEEAQAASRERAEARTRASEAQLRALAENLPGGAAFIIDRERRYQLATGEAIITAGLKPEDFLGRTVEEAVGHGMAAAYEPYLRQAFAGEAFSCEHESHGRNFLPRGVPLRNGSGEVESVLAVSYDITERKSAEEVRRQNEALFSTIIEQAPGGVYVVDDEFRVSQVNSESRGVFASAEPVIGRDFNEVMRIVWGAGTRAGTRRDFPPHAGDRRTLRLPALHRAAE